MSIGRMMKREAVKARYKEFVEGWRRERRYQKQQADAGTPVAPEVALGRRPTFSQWVAIERQAAERRAAEERAGAPVVTVDDIPELEWKDD